MVNNNQKSVKTFLHSNLIVPSGMTLFAKSKSFFPSFCSTVQKKKYNQPTHIAQNEEPWCRLHDAATVASTRRSATHYESQVKKPKSHILTFKENISLHLQPLLSLFTSAPERQPRLSAQVCV